jgi:hypothetical protein
MFSTGNVQSADSVLVKMVPALARSSTKSRKRHNEVVISSSNSFAFAPSVEESKTLCYLKTNHREVSADESPTHLSQMGGVYRATDAERDHLELLQAHDFEHQFPFRSLIELVSPNAFPFFTDVDTKRPITKEQMLTICSNIALIVTRLFGVDPNTAPRIQLNRFGYVVAMCRDSPNAHLHMPYLVVNRATGIRLTILLVPLLHDLRLDGISDATQAELATMLDIAVMTTNGLRSLLSHKIELCKCDSSNCLRCGGRGRTNLGDGRVYDLEHIAFTSADIPVKLNKRSFSPAQRIHLARVYIPETERERYLPLAKLKLTDAHWDRLDRDREGEALVVGGVEPLSDQGPDNDLGPRGKNRKRPGLAKKRKKINRPTQDEGRTYTRAGALLPSSLTLPKHVTFQQNVPAFFLEGIIDAIEDVDEAYSGVRVTKIRRFCRMLKVDVAGPSTCLNKGGPHNSHGIYFVINLDDGKVRQACYCKCDVNRLSGKKCKDFHSDEFSLVELPDDLFVGVRPLSEMRDDEEEQQEEEEEEKEELEVQELKVTSLSSPAPFLQSKPLPQVASVNDADQITRKKKDMIQQSMAARKSREVVRLYHKRKRTYAEGAGRGNILEAIRTTGNIMFGLRSCRSYFNNMDHQVRSAFHPTPNPSARQGFTASLRKAADLDDVQTVNELHVDRDDANMRLLLRPMNDFVALKKKEQKEENSTEYRNQQLLNQDIADSEAN